MFEPEKETLFFDVFYLYTGGISFSGIPEEKSDDDYPRTTSADFNQICILISINFFLLQPSLFTFTSQVNPL
jgi:hypothetical protein